MRRLLTVSLLLSCFTLTPSQAARWHRWVGAPTDGFRTGQYDQGEWIYTKRLRPTGPELPVGSRHG